MAIYLKEFSTHSEYEAYIASEDKVLPNVSICTTEGDVHYNPLIRVQGVSLNKSELSLAKGDTETLVATVIPSDAGNKSVTWSSSNDSVFTVNSNGLVTAVGDSGNATINVTTVDGGFTAQCAASILDPCASEKVKTTYEWVEIGGVKWATKNVGAKTITDYGQYFSWGGVNGFTADQVSGSCHSKAFTWADYELGNGGSSASDITKYTSSDGKTVLESVDDAATANMGSGWRMPTTAEYVALGNAVNTAWTQVDGVYGMLCTDKTDSSKTLFFPVCGYCSNGRVDHVDNYGGCWSSSLISGNVQLAYRLLFSSSGVYWQSGDNRCVGFPVRGVAD